MTYAARHIHGTCLFQSKLRQIAATGPASKSDNSLITQLGTESGSGALLVSGLRNCFSTFSNGITYSNSTRDTYPHTHWHTNTYAYTQE